MFVRVSTRALATAAMALLVPASAEISWAPTHEDATRRLEVAVTSSHTNQSHADCVVGGFDESNPAYIYVGGPCSGLTKNGSEYKTAASFRWLEMVTFHAELSDGQGGDPAELSVRKGTDGKEELFQYAKETAGSHAEVGVGGSFKFKDAGIPSAGFFMSTTSYLAKGSFEFSDNYFVTEKKGDKVTRVGPICTEVCDGSCGDKCPATKTKVTAGDYKYSVFAAAYDTKAGATDGWQAAIAKYGKGDPKTLTGNLNTYQGIDFTNMKADDVTITTPAGATVKYADMKECPATGCTATEAVEVQSVTFKSDGWEGMTITFPQKYNVGLWSMTGENFSPTPKDTKTVKIQMVKPNAAMLTEAPGNMKNSKKVVALMYTFDITGVTANATATTSSGAWMVYDPTVQNADKAKRTATASGQGAVAAAASHSLFFVNLLASFAAMCFFFQS